MQLCSLWFFLIHFACTFNSSSIGQIKMAKTFFSSVATLTEREKVNVNNKLEWHTCRSVHGCDIWNGRLDRCCYGELRFMFRGTKLYMKVHRLVYSLNNPHLVLSPDINVSHICHNSQCVKYEHLSYEPQSVNNQRQICRNNGECCGHYGFKDCILWDVGKMKLTIYFKYHIYSDNRILYNSSPTNIFSKYISYIYH